MFASATLYLNGNASYRQACCTNIMLATVHCLRHTIFDMNDVSGVLVSGYNYSDILLYLVLILMATVATGRPGLLINFLIYLMTLSVAQTTSIWCRMKDGDKHLN